LWLGIVPAIAASAFRSLYRRTPLAVAARGLPPTRHFAMFGPVFEMNPSLTAWRATIIHVVVAVVRLD
jgi:hypothetical protein